ncbi:Smr/MutS family protein [Vogesella sp. GCM10023246]|uniref:Smr/MutS family protein n=1 Tax=Vogesella oryzagri TaxID=3160864 RepID=A0ABV1M3Q4_9NEIS
MVVAANPEPEPDFSSLMRNVQPLKPDGRVQHPLPRPKPRPLRQPHSKQAASTPDGLFAQMLGWFEPADIAQQHRRPGMPSGTLRKLRSGHWPVCAELDLHGLDRFEAHERLALFLHRARQVGQCVRIIHGKGLSSRGEPVLPKMVRAWLSHHPDVLAFCETASHQGGSGAVLVLLKRPS